MDETFKSNKKLKEGQILSGGMLGREKTMPELEKERDEEIEELMSQLGKAADRFNKKNKTDISVFERDEKTGKKKKVYTR